MTLYKPLIRFTLDFNLFTPAPFSCPQVRPCLQLKDPRQSGSPQRLRSAFLGHSMAGPHPSCTQPGSAQIQDPRDCSLPNLRESLSLPPTRPLGLEFYETGLAFYKRQKEHLASSCFGSLPGKIKNPWGKRLTKSWVICWKWDEDERYRKQIKINIPPKIEHFHEFYSLSLKRQVSCESWWWMNELPFWELSILGEVGKLRNV